MPDAAAIARARAAWDSDDQFAAQYADPAGRDLVEGRWAVFEQALAAWRGDGQSRLAVLDAGCGDGINLLGLREIARRRGWPLDLHGFDRNPLRLARARRQTPAVALAALPNLPYGDGRFDVVLCNHVIEHIADYPAALRELRRVLRAGGLLLVGVPNEGCALARLRNNVLQRSILATTDHVNFFTAASLATALRDAGFAAPRIVGESFFWPHLRLARLVQRSGAGRRLTAGLGALLPGQAAGLIAAATV